MATINGTFLPDVLLGTTGDDTINGNGGNDIITAFGGDDVINGGAGGDVMSGGTGNDTYIIEIAAGDEVNYSLLDSLLGLQLFPATVVEVLGDTARIQVDLGNGPEIVEVDINLLDILNDVVNEDPGEGTDTILVNASFDLQDGTYVENLRTTDDNGTTGLTLSGNSYNNTITGNAGANSLYGEGGDDALIGGAGADLLAGGSGNDTMYVDDASDRVEEAVGGGTDRVAASVNYTLTAGAEVERLEALDLASTAALNLGVNEFDNFVLGSNGNNVLRGFDGDDTLHGLAGDDALIGDAGADTMYGGTGNDNYYVDYSGDRVYEFAGEGTHDRIATEVSYSLNDDSEIEVLEATNLNDAKVAQLVGNRFDNVVTGDAASNLLRGLAGNDTLSGALGDDVLIGDEGDDTMIGGAGNDTYYVDSVNDRVIEDAGAGNDRVSTVSSYALGASLEVETLEATNVTSTDALNLTGSNTANTIIGNDGANTIDGKGGNDLLIGAGGADTFAFTTALGAGNVDVIEGFQSGTDHIALDDAIFGGLQPGSSAADWFVSGTAALDANDRVIFDSSTGSLYYDADGSGAGAAVHFATIAGGLGVAAGDFVVI